jgi:hypothetical protein
MKLVEAEWFTLRDGNLIGIVIGTDDITGSEKAYIGLAPNPSNSTEVEDAEYILKHGVTFPLAAAKHI